jgi:hypothetical protein
MSAQGLVQVSKSGRIAALIAAIALCAPAAARADVTKAQCIDANTKGQDLRRNGKLAEAREQLRACADAACPGLVRDDCTKRLDELEHAQPTIVFDVKDGAGHDVSAVRVTVDGRALADRLTGAPLRVDPGEHVFAFEVAGQAPLTQSFVIREGEPDRHERVVLGGPAPSPAAAPAPASTPAPAPALASTPAPASGMGTQKILGLTAAGLGLAGVVVGSVFGVMTGSEINQQKTDCGGPSSCPSHPAALSDHSSASTDGTISTASFIAGGVLLAAGGVLFFTGGQATEPASTGRLTVLPSAGPGSAGISLRGRFW